MTLNGSWGSLPSPAKQAAGYLREHYKGGGIFSSFGDVVAIYREAGIPLRETLNECIWPHWIAAIRRPDLFLWEEWAVAISGDQIATAILRAQSKGPRYDCVKMIVVKGGPVIEIYRRRSASTMNIPYLKAHGAGNEFLFTFEKALREPLHQDRLADLSRAICDRHRGLGADGWYRSANRPKVTTPKFFCSTPTAARPSCQATVPPRRRHSGGCRFADNHGLDPYGSRSRYLRCSHRKGREFRFEMDMGRPAWVDG